MRIRKALPEDHPELTRLMRQSKAFWKYDPRQLREWEEELTISPTYIEQHQVLKLVDEGRIRGFYSYRIQPESTKLDNLFVHPASIGSGLGKLLMNDFTERVQRLPAQTIVLDADPNAEGFYRRLGFRTVSLKPTAIPRRFMPIMVKPLAASDPGAVDLYRTSRLSVRPLVMEDLGDFYDMQSNPRVMKFVKPPMNYEQSRRELERFIQYYDRRDIFFRIWAVAERATGSLIGICGVYLNEEGEPEIAYRLRELYWGRGLGGEIARSLIDYCFTILQYDELVANIITGNTASIRIAERLMRFDREISPKGDQAAERIYRIRGDDWQSRSQPPEPEL